MTDAYLLLKWIHILSSTILFGFGAGTAWYFWSAHRTGDPATIASVARMVVKADWIFTGTSGIVQPMSGILLVTVAGYSLDESWLVATYLLYILAFACWAPVVALQIKARKFSEEAVREGSTLDARYDRTMRLWFLLGWPAFLSLIAVYWLMVAKPMLW